MRIFRSIRLTARNYHAILFFTLVFWVLACDDSDVGSDVELAILPSSVKPGLYSSEAGGTVSFSSPAFSENTLVFVNQVQQESIEIRDETLVVQVPNSAPVGSVILVEILSDPPVSYFVFVKAKKAASLFLGDLTEICSDTEVVGSSGEILKGLRDCEGQVVVECSQDGEVGCLTQASFKAAAVENLLAENIKMNVQIAGVIGSVVPEAHSDCAADGETDCISNSIYKSVDSSKLLSSNILDGVTLGGVSGSLETFITCTSAGQSNCVAAGNFKAQDLSSAGVNLGLNSTNFLSALGNNQSYEFWDGNGQKHSIQGDSDLIAANIKKGVDLFDVVGTVVDAGNPDPWNIRVGVTIGETQGELRANCQNTANLTLFDAPSGGPDNTAGGGADDGVVQVWDTIDSYNGGSGFPGQAFPSEWDSNRFCDLGVWQDSTPDGSCDSAIDDCIYTDRITNLKWTEKQATLSDWASAVSSCENLDFGGIDNWRLPTKIELTDASNHGIESISNSNFFDVFNHDYWTATTNSVVLSEAWYVNLGGGSVSTRTKSVPLNYYICVSP